MRASSLAEVDGERKEKGIKKGFSLTRKVARMFKREAKDELSLHARAAMETALQSVRRAKGMDSLRGLEETISLPEPLREEDVLLDAQLVEVVSLQEVSTLPVVDEQESASRTIANGPSEQPSHLIEAKLPPSPKTSLPKRPTTKGETLTTRILSFIPTPLTPYDSIVNSYSSASTHRAALCYNLIHASTTLVALDSLLSRVYEAVRARIDYPMLTGMPEDVSADAATRLAELVREAVRDVAFWEEKVEGVRQVGSVHMEFWRGFEVEMRKVGWVGVEGVQGDLGVLEEWVGILREARSEVEVVGKGGVEGEASSPLQELMQVVGEVEHLLHVRRQSQDETSLPRGSSPLEATQGELPVEQELPAIEELSLRLEAAQPEPVEQGIPTIDQPSPPAAVQDRSPPQDERLLSPISSPPKSTQARPGEQEIPAVSKNPAPTNPSIPRLSTKSPSPSKSILAAKPKTVASPSVFDRLYTTSKRAVVDGASSSMPQATRARPGASTQRQKAASAKGAGSASVSAGTGTAPRYGLLVTKEQSSVSKLQHVLSESDDKKRMVEEMVAASEQVEGGEEPPMSHPEAPEPSSTATTLADADTLTPEPSTHELDLPSYINDAPSSPKTVPNPPPTPPHSTPASPSRPSLLHNSQEPTPTSRPPPTAPAAMRIFQGPASESRRVTRYTAAGPSSHNASDQPSGHGTWNRYSSTSLPSRRRGGLADILAQYKEANGTTNGDTDGASRSMNDDASTPVVAQPPQQARTTYHHTGSLGRSTNSRAFFRQQGPVYDPGRLARGGMPAFPQPSSGFDAGFAAGLFAAGFSAASLRRGGAAGGRGGYAYGGNGRVRGRDGRGGFGSLGRMG